LCGSNCNDTNEGIVVVAAMFDAVKTVALQVRELVAKEEPLGVPVR